MKTQKKRFNYFLILLNLLAFYLFIFPVPVYAYLDPGSGSYVFQIIIAFLLGGMIGLKMIWKKVLVFFKKLLSLFKVANEKTKN